MSWRVRLFGGLAVEHDGRDLDLSTLRERERALVAMLAIRARQVVPRDELVEALFGHLGPDRASANLRVAASRARAAIAHQLIESTSTGYRLGDATTDVEEFEAGVSAGHALLAQHRPAEACSAIEGALAMYRGDLLAGEAEAFPVAAGRTRLRGRWADAVDDLADSLIALGRPRDAVAHLERVLEAEPARESAYRRLMTAHYAAGEQDAALHAYERCRRALDEELGVDPLPETMALHERILRREAVAVHAAARASGLPFVARQAERIVLESIVARSPREGVFALVVGEPGSGKTRLVAEVVRGRTDVRVLATRCYEVETDLPFQPIRDALGAAPPAAASGDPAHARAALIEGYANAILATGGGAPVVWTIDDVQWADQSTLDVLHFIARRARGVAVIAAGRAESLPAEHPVVRLLTDLRREGRAERVSLAPLSVDDTAVLARASGVSVADAAQIHARAGGNAFFTTEILTSLRRGARALPETARDAILGRVHALPADARAVLEGAAVLGAHFRASEVAGLLETEEDPTARALGSLEGQELVRPLPGGEHEIVHDLVREAVYDAIPAAVRARLHGRAIEVIDRVRGEAGASLICYHAELAGDADCTFACAVVTGERALAEHAPVEAVASFDRALRQPADAQARRRCLTLRSEAKRLLGLGAEADADLAAATAAPADPAAR